MQWGQISFAVTGSAQSTVSVIYFPKAFSATAYSAVASISDQGYGAVSSNFQNIAVNSWTATTVSLGIKGTSQSSGTVYFYWQAIGPA